MSGLHDFSVTYIPLCGRNRKYLLFYVPVMTLDSRDTNKNKAVILVPLGLGNNWQHHNCHILCLHGQILFAT